MTAHNDSMGLVSVVIPTVVVNDYLQEAVDSVLQQSYRKVEVIVVLDGAKIPDPMPNYLQDSRVRLVVHDKNEGTPTALNSGIEASYGEFIARLDADDLALEGRLESQVAFLLGEPSVICVGTRSLLIDSVGNVVESSESLGKVGRVTRELLVRNPLLHSSVVYRADSVRAVGGYSLVMRRMQDYELYLRLARKGEMEVLPEILTAYRVHTDQFSKNTSPWTAYTRLILKRRLELARHLGEPILIQLLRNFAWFIGQVARHHGLLRPKYLRNVPASFG